MASPSSKPRFVDPAGAARPGALVVRPPFLFNGVTARVFPLKADMARLTHFCDQYLNMDIPAAIVQYRPALPYVYLMVLDYGSMSAASVQAQNVGWVAQHEVAFTVPLERWRQEGSRLVFKDWACVSPFIFVDDEMSLTIGREVYGWPKVVGRVDAQTSTWAQHPRSGSRVFTFSTKVFPKVYAGEAETSRVLLEIDSAPAPSYAEFPPDPANPWAPVSAVTGAVRSSLSLMESAADMVLALRVRGYRTNRNVASLRAMAGRAGDYLGELLPGLGLASRAKRNASASAAPGVPKLSFENVTVKQFRDAQEPDRACYKALVSSSMGIDRLNRSGLMGDMNLLRGDTSGGYRVRVHRYTSQPIIESFGLEVAATEEVGDANSVAILKPDFPFWTDVDLYYGEGQVICSRSHVFGDGAADAWVEERVDGSPPPVVPAASVAKEEGADHSVYSTALGAATQPVVGPFHFPDVTLQVYPLLADPLALTRLLEESLNEPLKSSGLSFKAFGSYVYLLVNVTDDQLGTMWSSANNIGWWAQREVSFCIPVKWYRDGELVSIGMVAPFVYSNNGRAVITDREVNGRPSVRASIDSPKDAWLDRSGPVTDRKFLHMETEVFPALHLGQKSQMQTLLEIDGSDVLPYNDDVGWRMIADKWGSELVDDLTRKTYMRLNQQEQVEDAKALALEILAYGEPINWFVLKQYRDAGDALDVCYQALVHTTRSITRIYDIREIEERVHVRLHRLPGEPIAQAFGLKTKSVDSSGGSVVDNFQPLRPFWMRISVKEELATVVATRASDGGWRVTHPWFMGLGTVPGATPFFRMPGPTRIAPGWGILHQRLKEKATLELRQSFLAELEAIKAKLGSLAAAERGDLEVRLAPSVREDLARLEAGGSVRPFWEGHSVEGLLALEGALLNAGLTWAPSADGRRRRLTHEEAAAAIGALEDVQLVVESILSDEWENWGNPRWYQGPPVEPKPEQCIPTNSIYGGSWILNRNAAGFVQDQALKVTSDGNWWYLDFSGTR